MRGGRRGGGVWRRFSEADDDLEEEELHKSSSSDDDEDSSDESDEEAAAAIRLEMEQQQDEEEDEEEEEENDNEDEEEDEEEIEFTDKQIQLVEHQQQEQEQEDLGGEGENQQEEEEEEEEGEEEGGDDEQQPDPPKLDEGFYEIEDVRKKRVHKGQTLYLIKWRGWPETANTWEPIENLQAIKDVVEAFEERLRSGTRGRKRKRRGNLSQPKKTHQLVPYSSVSGSKPGRKPRSLTSPAVGTSTPSVRPLRHRVASNKSVYSLKKGNEKNEGEGKNDDDNNVDTTAQQTGNENGSSQIVELRERTSTDNLNPESGKVSIHFSDMRTSGIVQVHGVGVPKVDFDENTQSNRFTGAKRRKSGNVKRFKKELALPDIGGAQNGDKLAVLGVEDGEGPPGMRRLSNPFCITNIIKPIGYSTSISNDIQDVCVTFVATSSDGREVVVDNKQLKADNPQLLISFYEQHLRYSPPA